MIQACVSIVAERKERGCVLSHFSGFRLSLSEYPRCSEDGGGFVIPLGIHLSPQCQNSSHFWFLIIANSQPRPCLLSFTTTTHDRPSCPYRKPRLSVLKSDSRKHFLSFFPFPLCMRYPVFNNQRFPVFGRSSRGRRHQNHTKKIREK